MVKTIILLFLGVFSVFAGAEEERFVFSISGEPDTLDPHATSGTLTFQVLRSLYDTLLEPDSKGNLQPALAESWKVSEDHLQWTFFLRKGVQFHHGKSFTADDVVATIDRIRSPDVASPHQSDYAAIQRVFAKDDHTVVFELQEPSASLLPNLASGWSAMLPADLVYANHDFATNPVGTGPFAFSVWEPDRRIGLLRNENYWQEGKPRIPALDFAILTDPAIQAQALMNGEIDGIDILSEPELSLLREHPDTQVYETTSALVLVIAINTRVGVLANREFREAISASIDRQTVIDIAYGGGQPVNTFIDPHSPYYVVLPDISRNSEWITEVFTRLASEKSFTITVPSNYSPHVQAAQMYQEMLRKQNLNVDIALVDWSRWISEVYRNSEYEMTVIGHTGSLDPDRQLSAYGRGDSYVGWKNEEFVALIEKARTLTDKKERIALYQQALRLMGQDIPFIYIGVPHRQVGLRKGVKNFSLNNQLDTYDFRDLILQ